MKEGIDSLHKPFHSGDLLSTQDLTVRLGRSRQGGQRVSLTSGKRWALRLLSLTLLSARFEVSHGPDHLKSPKSFLNLDPTPKLSKGLVSRF